MNATSAYTLLFNLLRERRTDRPRGCERFGGAEYDDVYLPVCPIVISPEVTLYERPQTGALRLPLSRNKSVTGYSWKFNIILPSCVYVVKEIFTNSCISTNFHAQSVGVCASVHNLFFSLYLAAFV